MIFVLLLTFEVSFSQDKEKDTVKSESTKELTYKKLLKEGNVKQGLFNVYVLKEDYYFEITDSLLIRDLLIDNKIIKNELLSKIKALSGYGGLIHDFKNYVLRHDSKYRTNVIKQYAQLNTLLNNFNTENNEINKNVAIIQQTLQK